LLQCAIIILKEMIILSIAIRINDSLYQEAKERATAEFRSVPEQIEFWATIGKLAMENPELPTEFIRDILVAKREKKSEPFEFR
jgi:hypothetical protein